MSLKWIYIKDNKNNNSNNKNDNNNSHNSGICPQITVNEQVKSVVFGDNNSSNSNSSSNSNNNSNSNSNSNNNSNNSNSNSRDPCSLISIFGAARQGKSFLMNCLSGTTGLFTISNLSTPCTQGIDISRNLISLKTFSEIDGGRSSQSQGRERTRVGFVDAEGQGDRDVTYDSVSFIFI